MARQSVTISLDDSLYAQVKLQAKKNNRKVSHLIEEYLFKWIKENKEVGKK